MNMNMYYNTLAGSMGETITHGQNRPHGGCITMRFSIICKAMFFIFSFVHLSQRMFCSQFGKTYIEAF